MKKTLYIENQYLGRDRGWLSVRLLLALFCFVAYYINIEHERNNRLFLVAGAAIVFISMVMMYVQHYRIIVTENSVQMSELWTARLVKIDVNSIINVENKQYSTFLINNPVYNLHQKGKVRFYAGGKKAVWITDREGLVYIIGSQHPNELVASIKQAQGK